MSDSSHKEHQEHQGVEERGNCLTQRCKTSDVAWFGDVPEGWVVKRLASYFVERRVKVSDKDYPPLSVTRNGIMPQLENVAKTNDGDNRKLVRKGDFVINSRSDRKGSSGVSDYDGSASLINLVLQPRGGLYGAYCNYLLKSLSFVEENYRNGRGIVADLWTTRYDEMKMIKVAMPPLAEQEAIVAYLDAETGRIDKAIAAEEKMIALLQERREIVINEAVVARDGWEVKYGKCIFCENKRKNKALDQETILSLSYGKIVVKKSRDEGLVPAEYSSYQVLSPGNIVIRCTDLQNDQTSLRVGYVENHGIITSAYLGLIVNEGYYPKFVFYCLHAWDVSKEIYRYGSGLRQSLSWVDFKYLPLSFPPLAEQEAIVARLDEETGKIDRAIEVKRRQIELLRERRQIVIDEVVTGKVKVA